MNLEKLDMIKYIPEDEHLRITTFIDTVNNPYQKNKKMSIMLVEVLLNNNAKWLEYFKSHPKQDDLADSLLMTLHYCSFLKKQDLEKPARKSRAQTKPLQGNPANKSRELEGLKPSQEDIDAESSAMLDEVKSKKRNRILVNKKHKDNAI